MKKKLPATSTKETQQKYRPANVFNVPGGNPLQVRMLKSNLLSPPGRFRPRGRHTYSYSYLFSLNEITSTGDGKYCVDCNGQSSKFLFHGTSFSKGF